MKAKIAPELIVRAQQQPWCTCERAGVLRGICAAIVTGGALALMIGLLVPRDMVRDEPMTWTANRMDPQSITVESVVMEGERATIKIKNQSPFLVTVHTGGIRVGWMRPHRVGIIRGLTSGYHKFFVHSQYGTVSLGPKEVWVPGSWSLTY